MQIYMFSYECYKGIYPLYIYHYLCHPRQVLTLDEQFLQYFNEGEDSIYIPQR